MGRLMRQAGGDWLGGADAVVPVPLHPWRQVKRGFNQADELARTLGPPVWRSLRRRTHGVPQASLSGADRQVNVREAYCLKGAWRRGRTTPRRVVLVDDVMTTGATLDACSRALREAGVEWIGALTLARASASGPPAEAIPRQPPPPAPHSATVRR